MEKNAIFSINPVKPGQSEKAAWRVYRRNLPEVIQVLDCIVTGHQYVIKVCKTEREAAQNLINESLESLSNIP